MPKKVLITGVAGLIGSETALQFARLGYGVVGVDNDLRSYFFGPDGSTAWRAKELQRRLGSALEFHDFDIRDRARVEQLVADNRGELAAVVHTAAQPSHDWAAREVHTDFGVNAVGTLNMLEAVRQSCPETPFIFTSTNKVYGDRPNTLPLIELETRYELPADHPFSAGITEDMSIDQSLHSVFGASKLAADIMVQEYGRYFGIPTACFRGGTLTGPGHSAAELHGFLAYLMKCTVEGRPYRIYGYQGKQVRDAIHSADLVSAFVEFARAPRVAAVYNIGGGRHSNCSVLEGIELCQEIAGRKLDYEYVDTNRIGDHIWWVGSNSLFESHYPSWSLQYSLEEILVDIFSRLKHEELARHPE